MRRRACWTFSTIIKRETPQPESHDKSDRGGSDDSLRCSVSQRRCLHSGRDLPSQTVARDALVGPGNQRPRCWLQLHGGSLGVARNSVLGSGDLSDRRSPVDAAPSVRSNDRSPSAEFQTMSAPEIYSPGLEGVIAGETAVSTVDGGLRYRGYPVTELAEKCSFDEVAYLLLYGDLPTKTQLTEFEARVAAARRLPAPLKDLFPTLPKWTLPMDSLRSAVSILSHFDQDVDDNSTEANLRKAERLYAQIPLAIAEQFRAHKGLQPIKAVPELGHAASFLYILRGKEATPEEVRAFNVSLTLYAEHEFNASTFTARVAVSTLSDLHSGVVAAIGALKGPLHGGANEKVMDLLTE